MATDIFLFLVGIAVGAVNAIAGGGGLLAFPALLAVGVPPIMANATNNIAILPGAMSAVYEYRKYLRRVPKQYLYLLIPAVIGGFIGAYLLRHTSPEEFAKFVPWLLIFAVTLFAYQPFLYKYIHDHIHASHRRRNQLNPIFWVALAMLPLSIYGGYFGAGFGFIMLAFLGFTKLHDHIHRMNALKSLAGIAVSISALTMLLGHGLIDWRHGLVMAAGNLIGGYYAAKSSQHISTHALRVGIVIAGICAAVYLALRSY